MYVWVLNIFDRDDKYCEYDSKVVAVYSKENFDDAMEDFEMLCSYRIDEGDEIEEWENKDGYHFSSKSGRYENFTYSYVGLKKMEVI